MSRPQALLRSTTLILGMLGVLMPTNPAVSQQATQTVPSARPAATIDKRPLIRPQEVKFGAYDPHGDFGEQNGVATEHLFLPWEDVDLETLRVADAYAAARGRNLLITVEPWSWDVDWRLTSDELRVKLLRGDYDPNMKAIAEIIAQLKSPVILRWGQEMEDKSGRFSWSNWPAQDYITSYRRMMDIVRKYAPATKLMWSPKGLPGLEAYYPGDNYADFVGLSVFGFEPYDKIEYGKPRNFAEALTQGYDLVARFDKPIWVAELGYEGSDAYLQPWIETVTLNQANFPALSEVVYFNDREIHAWPFGLGRPNWRVVKGDESN